MSDTISSESAQLPRTPRDWVIALETAAKSPVTPWTGEQAAALARVLSGLVSTVEQLEGYVHRLQERQTAARAEVRSGDCPTCSSRTLELTVEPCRSCIDGSGYQRSGQQPTERVGGECQTCVHLGTAAGEAPCWTCVGGSRYEAVEPPPPALEAASSARCRTCPHLADPAGEAPCVVCPYTQRVTP